MSTTTKERTQVLEQLYAKGISYHDAQGLRQISLTLRRWFELECGNGHGHIERDETTGKPRYHRDTHSFLDPHDPRAWSHIADREAGAYKRLAVIMAKYPALIHYVQTDCRGVALYVLTVAQASEGGYPLDSIYNRGIAVY